MPGFFQKKKTVIWLSWLALIVLVAVLAYAAWGITQDLAAISLQGVRRNRLFGQLPQQTALAPSEVQGWMTFRYLNLVFRLPPEVLHQALAINNSRYPNLSVSSLAKQQNKAVTQELLEIQSAINSYAHSQINPK